MINEKELEALKEKLSDENNHFASAVLLAVLKGNANDIENALEYIGEAAWFDVRSESKEQLIDERDKMVRRLERA